MRPRTTPSRRDLLRAVGAAALAGLAGCSTDSGAADGTDSGAASDGAGTTGTEAGTGTGTPTPTGTATTTGSDWRTVELTDVTTGESFTIESLAGQPVLLEFFAVWCPVCTAQQEALATLVDRRDDVVAVSLNTDPNEDAGTVREHAASKGFDWRYAVAPPPMTRALVAEFGSVVTSPPSAPVVRRCPDGRAALVEGRGVKSADALASALEEC
jgi:cytochrome oxidase Cu insertion factor (SCO1/SenC/PrrC family)